MKVSDASRTQLVLLTKSYKICTSPYPVPPSRDLFTSGLAVTMQTIVSHSHSPILSSVLVNIHVIVSVFFIMIFFHCLLSYFFFRCYNVVVFFHKSTQAKFLYWEALFLYLLYLTILA